MLQGEYTPSRGQYPSHHPRHSSLRYYQGSLFKSRQVFATLNFTLCHYLIILLWLYRTKFDIIDKICRSFVTAKDNTAYIDWATLLFWLWRRLLWVTNSCNFGTFQSKKSLKMTNSDMGTIWGPDVQSIYCIILHVMQLTVWHSVSIAWYLCKMGSQNMLRTYEVK